MIPSGGDHLTATNNGDKPNSTMKRVTVDFAEDTPLYQQVAAEIRRAIAEGEARPGERMPLAKDLATILGVNTNTVLRALRELRDEGMLEFRRGRGITVAGTPERGVVMARVKDLVAFARQQGYQPAEVIAMIEAVS
jgi:GntR family transcriptional regulator